MKKIFFSDIDSGLNISYASFISDLKERPYFCKYCKAENFYEYFKCIVLAALADREIVLLDSDFSDQEIERFVCGDIGGIKETCAVDTSGIVTFDDILSKVKSAKNFKITLFTSGTTGIPKKVSHSFETITRQVRASEKFADDIWGFAYNPTHIAGVQVFFQAFLNRNTIVKLFGLPKDGIVKSIEQLHISRISATPTFYRLLLPLSKKFEEVKSLTSGGERFDSKTLESLKEAFPSAKITNVYASTEAGSLFASKDDLFTLNPKLEGLVKIVDSEIWINKKLLGESSSLKLDGDWYHTGDIIQKVSDNPFAFKFVSRKNEMINVGGYKVNPGEVESEILKIDGVREVRVFGRKNAILGNIVCAEICLNDRTITEQSIRIFLKKNLQDYKVPRIINFVDEIKCTKTGKLFRNQ